MAMSPRLLRPRATVHPEAQSWASRVSANGGTFTGSTLSAVSKFCRDIDAAGIRDKFYRLNLFCGDGLSAALVPLYRAESRTASVRGNTTDTNNNFVSGDFNNTGSSSGLTGNGSTKFLNTGVSADTITASNLHFGIGFRATTDSSGYRTAIGAWNGLVSGAVRIYQVSIRRADANTNCVFGDFSSFVTGRFFGESVNNANLSPGNIVAAWPTLYRNGSASGANATASDNYASAHNIFVFALSNANVATDYTASRLNWYSIGLTMTAAQVASFNTALSTFNTTLSRT